MGKVLYFEDLIKLKIPEALNSQKIFTLQNKGDDVICNMRVKQTEQLNNWQIHSYSKSHTLYCVLKIENFCIGLLTIGTLEHQQLNKVKYHCFSSSFHPYL